MKRTEHQNSVWISYNPVKLDQIFMSEGTKIHSQLKVGRIVKKTIINDSKKSSSI